MYRILIADDHAIVRQGVKQIVLNEFSTAIIGEARTAQEVLELLDQNVWDVVILDLTMPGTTGLNLLKQIKGTYPKLPVLVLSMHPEDQYAASALKAGVAGYLTKESATDELVRALQKIF